MSECVFCDIVAGTAPARTVYENERVIAFLDIRPIAIGHTLIIPRTHCVGLLDISPDDAGAVYAATRRIVRAVRGPNFGADGANVVVNDGRAAQQTVFHHHMHVIPRSRGDKARMARGFVLRRDSNPDATAARLRSAVAET